MSANTKKVSMSVLFSLLVGVLLTTTGCGGDSGQQQFESTGNLKAIIAALQTYQKDNGGWPDALDQVIEANSLLSGKMANPLTGDNPGYEYVKPGDDATAETIVLYQLRDGKRDETVEVAYLDGSVRPIEKQE